MPETLNIHPDRISPRAISRAVEILRAGELAILPTDTGYAIVCSLDNKNGLKSLNRIKNVTAEDTKKPLSVLFSDLSDIAQYVHSMPNPVFRTLRRTLPGPYTFILRANKRLRAASLKGRNTLGIRVPDNAIASQILSELGSPLLATSAKPPTEDDFLIDPLEIPENTDVSIGLVIDSGPIYTEPSTVVDFSSGDAEILREGKGPVEAL